ncbi:bromodomain-containing protein 1 isoform X2 [Spodoptera frugiperda]|uniref:Bromodomain-containing protein 1 isoform X2 n=1 Tax=Spodoptera frugiperda TaxID=7108 RepID=A0A9R0EVP6_SPOFR|nr:bromodomain-containing protein 1 isoform X2 [Spodoptera frugiperda]
MGLDFDVFEFCKKLRQNRPPPYQCPLEKCDKVYKSLCGLQYHLVHYDHDNPTPATPAVANHRKKGRGRAAVPTGDIALQSPPKEALTFAEAQKVVQFEIDGKISRIPIDQPLPIMSLEEWQKTNAELEKPLPVVEPPVEPHVKLPEASFKLVDDYNERVCDAPPRPNAYIRFIEKSAEELDGEVEYDVDEEDTAWLAIINKTRAKQNLPAVTVDTLELLMDRLEKESYFQASQNGQQTAATVDEDAVCCICMDGECQNTNVILFCDMCNLAVHQDCYGVPYIPEGQWLCRRCLQSPSRLVNCVLCPNTGGAFKQTDQGTWAHVVCALWIPEVRFANTVFLEPIDSIEMIPAARWKLQCMVCKQRSVGACIQCHKSNCYSAFHVTCAQQAGLYMKMEAAGAGRDPSQPVQVAKMAYCDAHTPAHILQERRAQESESGDSKSNDLTAIRQKGREKIKQARRVLAMKRTWAPVVLVPTLPADRVAEVAALAPGAPAARAQLMKRLLAYWTLKRHSRNGVPLLRRLQSLTSNHGTRGIQDGTVNVRELCNQLKYWQRIRQDLERARLLCELVRKRERLKAEYTRVWERCVLHSLRPERAALHKLLRLLRQKDASDIFTEPVDLQEVPDYSTIVKHPMDLSTMGKKLDRGAYATIDDMEADFKLMIDNCLTYNNKDTVFYKAGVKMREQCLPLFRAARRDVREAGLQALCLPPASPTTPGPDSPPRNCAPSPRRASPLRSRRSMSRAASRPRSSSESEREPTPERRKDRSVSKARSERRQSVAPKDSDDENIASHRATSPASGRNKPFVRGRGRTRGRRGGRPRGRGRQPAQAQRAMDNDTPTSGSETPVPGTTAERTLKLATPEKSPVKQPETPPRLGLMGALRKPTLLVSPSTVVAPPKSFGSDASLPTLSASLGRSSLESSPKKKGRGRPRKQDKDKSTSSPDLFRSAGGGEGASVSTPVPESFLQYRGPPGEVGSDSDLALSRSSSSSSAWSQSCSSCTHYEDGASDHSCSMSSTDGSSFGDAPPSLSAGACSPAGGPRPGRRARRTAHHTDVSDAEPTTPVKGRGTRSSTSKTPVKCAQASTLQLEPLQLVWAKCRGYPWYPALIIDPKIPKGFIYNGVPLPVPPQDVLNLKKNHAHEPILYLVLFFDVKRTWQWLPPNKLEPLGLDKSVDQAKLVESRKPTDRKAVKKAYGDAMQFRKQVHGDDK